MSKKTLRSLAVTAASLVLIAILLVSPQTKAAIPPPGPASGSSGLQGTVPTPPPKIAATIGSPSGGQTFDSMPIAITGLCTKDLLVKIFANNVFVGSVLCTNGSYTLQVSLLDGRNDLVARIFDSLDQAGPDSNVVTVTYNNAQFAANGTPLLTLSSLYARRGANPGEQLQWPITISGGNPPYALSMDWGDGKPSTLYSVPISGTTTTSHVYAAPGTYVVIVKATDKDGRTAFLQLVGQSNGAVTQSATSSSNGKGGGATTVVVWIPAAVCIPLLGLSFWLGRRYELLSLRRNLERPR